MSNTSNFRHPQDDFGPILSAPLGTESVAACRPEPIIKPTGGMFTPSAADCQASQHNQSIDAQSGGGRRLLLVLGTAALAACVGLGLLAWFR